MQKLRQIYPSPQVPDAFAKMGRAPADGCPLGWLRAVAQDIERAIPTEEERRTAVVYGLDRIRVVYTDTLTPEEAMRDELADAQQRLSRAAALLPRDGEALTAEQVQALRQALKG